MVTTNKVIIAGEVRGDGELENIDNNKQYMNPPAPPCWGATRLWE